MSERFELSLGVVQISADLLCGGVCFLQLFYSGFEGCCFFELFFIGEVCLLCIRSDICKYSFLC